MQGPYYNWNRWYLPGVGRYLESDPIASAGEAKAVSWTPDWYTYVMGNPLVYTNRMGLDIDVCFYADAAWGLGHVGFGPGGSRQTSGFYPNSWDPFRDWGEIRPDQQKKQQCKTLPSPPEKDQCMENCRARRGAKPGPYNLVNRNCTGFVRECLKECRLDAGPYGGPAPSPFFDGLKGQ